MENQKKAEYDVQAAKELGAELRQIRKKQNLGVSEVASRLKLSPEQIDSLEQGDYTHFSGLVFVSGFLRSYARLLKMDEQQLSGRLKTIIPKNDAGHVYAVDRQQSKFEYRHDEETGFPKWILGVAAGILIGGAIYAWQSKSNQENYQQNAQESSAVQNSLQAPPLKASNVTVAKMASGAEQAASQVQNAHASAASSASAPAEPAVVVAPDELWIKVAYRSNLIVKDKDGKMVFSRIIQAGSEQRFKGGAPYDVWIGISGGAEANYGGQPIDLSKHREPGKKSALFIAGKK